MSGFSSRFSSLLLRKDTYGVFAESVDPKEVTATAFFAFVDVPPPRPPPLYALLGFCVLDTLCCLLLGSWIP